MTPQEKINLIGNIKLQITKFEACITADPQSADEAINEISNLVSTYEEQTNTKLDYAVLTEKELANKKIIPESDQNADN